VPDEQASAYHRLRLDAQLYRPASSLQTNGPSRKVGKRLPGKALVNNPYLGRQWWMKDWYGRVTILHTSATAVWYKTGMPAVPIRWVLIKDPKGSLNAPMQLETPVQMQWFRSRWQVEVTLRKPVPIWGWISMVITGDCPHYPALLALFSIVTLVAHQQLLQHPFELPSLVSEDTTDVCRCASACWTALANADFSDVEM